MSKSGGAWREAREDLSLSLSSLMLEPDGLRPLNMCIGGRENVE